ncbi:acetyl-CoA carboxylase biotin carboxylase subunit family protein [Kitasatospora sp. NPDC094011]|uniref:ATP-grasp domain-containing protein n=1 Tax=Kitasatospora sp. NPDC094011 TaxID=3364090 RepID=UPI003801F938
MPSVPPSQSDPQNRPDALLLMGDLVVLARQGRLITEARRRGLAPLAVVSLDTDLDRLAELRADASHPLSGLAEVVQVADAQVATVAPAVQPLLRRYHVRGVISVGEVFVEPVGVLADTLGLPGTGSKAALICRNKLLQRTAAPAYAPSWQTVPADERAGFTLPAERLPAVVKPAGRFYSSGVRMVHDQEELTAALAALAPHEIALVESRVVGPEFSVEALVQGGEVLWSGVTGKESNESGGSFFTEVEHTSPAELDEASRTALVEANREVLRSVGVRDGITHAEYRLTEDGVVLMEVAARLPGDAITFLWELATGEGVEPAMIDLATGVPTSHPQPRRRARQHFVDHPHGRLVDVTAEDAEVSWIVRDDRWPVLTPLDPQAPAALRGVLVGRRVGDLLDAQVDSGHRSASLIVDAPLDESIDGATKTFTDQVRVIVDPHPTG